MSNKRKSVNYNGNFKKGCPTTQALIYRLIFGLSILGLIVPFAAQFVLPFFFPDVNVAGVEVWNQFVGIILGMIATIMSIVSLVLCYRSDHNSTEAYHKIELTLEVMNTTLNNISKKQDDISNSVQRTTKIQVDSAIGTGIVANDEKKP